ncbi:MAG: hypothetical protein JNL83_22495 [Myxococcales bacterium]|nr:hypothetical protein [Myxococcales bacterium]
MHPRPWITAAFAVALCHARASAEHDHGGHAGHGGHGDQEPRAPSSRFDVGIGIVLARYETRLYAGDYQGLRPMASWARGRLGVSATLGLYRITENGATYRGLGDLHLGVGVLAWSSSLAWISVGAPVSLPVGDDTHGLGMGHVMVMPTVAAGISRVTASVTYGRAIGGAARHAQHGVWPLVDPMNQQELAGSLAVSLPLAHKLHLAGRLGGALAIGDGGDRIHAAWEAVWTEGRVTTRFDLFTGLASDPVVVGGGLRSEVSF